MIHLKRILVNRNTISIIASFLFKTRVHHNTLQLKNKLESKYEYCSDDIFYIWRSRTRLYCVIHSLATYGSKYLVCQTRENRNVNTNDTTNNKKQSINIIFCARLYRREVDKFCNFVYSSRLADQFANLPRCYKIECALIDYDTQKVRQISGLACLVVKCHQQFII